MPAKRRTGAAPAFLWIRSAVQVFAKEARVEWRSRNALGATLLFSVCSLTGIAYVLAFKSVGADVKSALLWIILLFAAMSGLARSFVREEEMGTADALRLAAPASVVLAGKLAFNAILMLVVEAVTLPLFLIVLPVSLGQVNASFLAAVMMLGGFGLAATATFVAALIAPAASGGTRSALFFVVAFPALVPVLLASVNGTLAALAPLTVPENYAHNSVVALMCYDVVVTAAAFLLFGAVWTEGEMIG